jgi:hypothetical protein
MQMIAIFTGKMMKLVVALFVVMALVCEAFRMQNTNMRGSSLSMSLNDYKEQLAKTASAIAGPGKLYFSATTSSV